MGEDALLSEVGRIFIETLPPEHPRPAGRRPAGLPVGTGWGLAPGPAVGLGLERPRRVGLTPGRADAQTRWALASRHRPTEALRAHRGA